MYKLFGQAVRVFKRGRVVVCLLTALAIAAPAAAQLDRSRISGTIKDESGAVVPGVTVTATNLSTQTPTVVVTDGSGLYTFPSLTPGRYSVSAELSGFRKVVNDDVQLDAAGAINLDFTLTTGALTETVTVSGNAPLQTDVAIRKTVEAKDIELLAFSGRNPIGVVGLKAGVNGGNFNSRGFGDLGNGGFNINGSRPDENNITIDGAVAIRTRSSGNIIGIQNVDAVQEVQVLTANYMPEYGRASGGQIRFITKSGSNRFTGTAGFYLRDETLQANSWARNRSTNPLDNQGPAPFDYKQYGYSFGGPIAWGDLRNKLFFFGAQEWVDFNQIQTNTATVPTARMRSGDFGELLDPANGFITGTRVISDPRQQPAVPEQRHPGGPAVGERPGVSERVPPADARLPGGHCEPDPEQRRADGAAQGQPALRLPPERQSLVRRPLLGLCLHRAGRVPGHVPVRAPHFRPAELHVHVELDRHADGEPDRGSELHAVARRRLHRRLHRDRPLQAVADRHQLPLYLPGQQGDPGQDPDHQHRRAIQLDRRRSVPRFVARADSHHLGHDDLRQGPSYDEGGRLLRVLRRGRLRPDQRRTRSPAAPTTRTASSSSRTAVPAAPASASPTPPSACSAITPRSASARSPSGGRSRPTSSSRIRGGRPAR